MASTRRSARLSTSTARRSPTPSSSLSPPPSPPPKKKRKTTTRTPKTPRTPKPKPAITYSIPPVPSLTTSFHGRLGYACLNTLLRHTTPASAAVFCSRTCRIATLNLEGIGFAKDLGLKNARDLITLIKWNEAHGIRFMRVSSDMFPFASHPVWGYSLEYAQDVLAEAGELANRLGHRLTTHPGQFTQLGSNNDKVIEASVRELCYHAEMLDRMHQGPDAVMIIHGGGTYGDKAAALKRIRHSVTSRLPPHVRARLVLENDELCYSAHDLLPLCEELDIPLVFDYHHDDINPGPLVAENDEEGSVVVDPLAIVDGAVSGGDAPPVGGDEDDEGVIGTQATDMDVGETQATDVGETQVTDVGETQATDVGETQATEDPPSALLNELGYRSVPQGFHRLLPITSIIARSRAIWDKRGIRPKVHLSEPRPTARTIPERRAHADRVARLPAVLEGDVDLMIEAKDKEQAVLQLYRTYGLGEVDAAILRPPGWRGDKTPRKKKAVPADVDDGSDEDLELVDGGGRARARKAALDAANEGGKEGAGEEGEEKAGAKEEGEAGCGKEGKEKGAKEGKGAKSKEKTKTKKADRPISAKWEGAGSGPAGATGDDAAGANAGGAADAEMEGAAASLQDAMLDASDGAEEAAQAVGASAGRKSKWGNRATPADAVEASPSGRKAKRGKGAADAVEGGVGTSKGEGVKKKDEDSSPCDGGLEGACDGGLDTTEGVGASIDGEVVVVGGEVAGGKKRKRGKGRKGVAAVEA